MCVCVCVLSPCYYDLKMCLCVLNTLLGITTTFIMFCSVLIQLISDVLLWTPAYGQAKAGRPARTYIQQLRDDTGCSPEDQPEAKNDREK